MPSAPEPPTRRIARPAPIRQTLLALAVAAALGAPASAEVVNAIVLRVNDNIATLEDYEARRRDRVDQLLAAGNLAPEQRQELLASAGKDTMKEIFDELLLLSRADQIGADVSAARVDEAYADARQRAGVGEEEFVAAMRGAGLTPATFRERLKRQLLFQEVIGREVQPRIEVDDEEVGRYYRENQEAFRVGEELRLRDLVVLETSTPDPAQRVWIGETIRTRVEAGESFDDVAAELAPLGIVGEVANLGFVGVADLDPELAKAAAELAVGAISVPVPGRGGHHLLQLLARREATVRPLEDVQEEIRRSMRNERFERELQTYLRELAEKAYIQQNPPPEAAGFRAVEAAVEGVETPPEPPPAEPATAPMTGTPSAEPGKRSPLDHPRGTPLEEPSVHPGPESPPETPATPPPPR